MRRGHRAASRVVACRRARGADGADSAFGAFGVCHGGSSAAAGGVRRLLLAHLPVPRRGEAAPSTRRGLAVCAAGARHRSLRAAQPPDPEPRQVAVDGTAGARRGQPARRPGVRRRHAGCARRRRRRASGHRTGARARRPTRRRRGGAAVGVDAPRRRGDAARAARVVLRALRLWLCERPSRAAPLAARRLGTAADQGGAGSLL